MRWWVRSVVAVVVVKHWVSKEVLTHSTTTLTHSTTALTPQHLVISKGNLFRLSKDVWLTNNSNSTPAQPQQRCNVALFYNLFKKHGCCKQPSKEIITLEGQPGNYSLRWLFEQHWVNRRIGLVGDSVTQQLIEALLKNAHAEGIPQPQLQQEHFRPKFRPKIQSIAVWSSFNITLTRYGDGGAISPVPSSSKMDDGDLSLISINIKYTDRPELFHKAVQGSDMLYVNFGVHLNQGKVTVEQVTQLFQYTRQVLESDMDQHPHKRHFYRLTLPQHFTGVNGSGVQYTDRRSGECVAFGVETQEHWTNPIARQVFEGSKVRVLDYQDFVLHRGDLHSIHNQDDCTHWCYDYQMWRGVFYLFYAALVE